jgi:pimeloyl-ACP methyl ester carboxylesterase
MSTGHGIEYDVTGQRPPVVLLHGFPDSGRVWRHQCAGARERLLLDFLPR